MFNEFDEVQIRDKIYKFKDSDANEYEIVALVIEARKELSKLLGVGN
mgnify:CR=1 FL=1